MLAPLLTEEDEPDRPEGSIDPLGLYPVADALGVSLVPGVRERQSHPRFLTAMAVSLAVCGELEGEIAADGVSEPWQVFEWYLVEGLVRALRGDEAQLQGLPGREKAALAVRDGVPLSATRYLKTPTVFGFHGVYRLLARTLGIERSGRLGMAGYDLLNVWSDEQGLTGFHASIPGRGSEWYKRLRDAVVDGLAHGAVDRKAGWAGWTFFRDHLAHLRPGPEEAAAIWGALADRDGGYRQPIAEFLLSDHGQRLWRDTGSEQIFHRELRRICKPKLKTLLAAIDAYETFARLLHNAFYDCLLAMSQTSGKTTQTMLAQYPSVVEASRRIPELYPNVLERLAPYGESLRFQTAFQDLANRLPPAQWVAALLAHHKGVQHRKPPGGKAPWFERFDDGGWVIRPAYRQEGPRQDREGYVHAYRTQSLWSFAIDLGRVA